jgi:isopentenyldiphosphate isomerase
LWIQNPKGGILLAKRKITKRNAPGRWGPAVAGTNEKSETYNSNIIKETEEEIGLKNFDFKKADKIKENNFFCQWFTLIIDKKLAEFTIQKEEVEQIRWATKDALLQEINSFPERFLEQMDKYIHLFTK